MPTLLFPLT